MKLPIIVDTKSGYTKYFLLCLIMLLAICIAYAETYPSKLTSVSTNSNMTKTYPLGTTENGTRGYIYNLTINETQPAFGWIGYVGNINGVYGLVDGSDNALYDWTIVTITGELYATKESTYVAAAKEDTNPYAGGIPDWSNMMCANSTMINMESGKFSHPPSEEDRYNQTFTNHTVMFNNWAADTINIYVGPRNINTSTNRVAGSEDKGCYGTFLKNGSEQSTYWPEVVLTDMSYQNGTAANLPEDKAFDLIYATQLRNDSTGFDGNKYDFQILLPQSGSQGIVDNIAYYFYVELI